MVRNASLSCWWNVVYWYYLVHEAKSANADENIQKVMKSCLDTIFRQYHQAINTGNNVKHQLVVVCGTAFIMSDTRSVCGIVEARDPL